MFCCWSVINGWVSVLPRPALDENVEKLLCSLRSLPGLQKVYLKASIQTIQWASQTVSLISHPANLKEIK